MRAQTKRTLKIATAIYILTMAAALGMGQIAGDIVPQPPPGAWAECSGPEYREYFADQAAARAAAESRTTRPSRNTACSVVPGY